MEKQIEKYLEVFKKSSFEDQENLVILAYKNICEICQTELKDKTVNLFSSYDDMFSSYIERLSYYFYCDKSYLIYSSLSSILNIEKIDKKIYEKKAVKEMKMQNRGADSLCFALASLGKMASSKYLINLFILSIGVLFLVDSTLENKQNELLCKLISYSK